MVTLVASLLRGCLMLVKFFTQGPDEAWVNVNLKNFPRISPQVIKNKPFIH